MPVADFVSMMQKTRQAVEIYFDMVMKAEKGLNDFLKGDSKAASIANAFKETLTKEFAEKNGVEIHSFSPQHMSMSNSTQKVRVTRVQNLSNMTSNQSG